MSLLQEILQATLERGDMDAVEKSLELLNEAANSVRPTFKPTPSIIVFPLVL